MFSVHFQHKFSAVRTMGASDIVMLKGLVRLFDFRYGLFCIGLHFTHELSSLQLSFCDFKAFVPTLLLMLETLSLQALREQLLPFDVMKISLPFSRLRSC